MNTRSREAALEVRLDCLLLTLAMESAIEALQIYNSEK